MRHRSGWLSRLTGALLFMVGSAASGMAPSPVPSPSILTEQSRWALSWSAEAGPKPEFRGLKNLDGAGTAPGSMVYPGGSAGVMLISVLTHAAIVGRSVQREMQAQQERADQILVPHADVLAKFEKHDFLMQTRIHLRAMASPFEGGLMGEAHHAPWQVEIRPIYQMSQDRQALVVDVMASIKASGASGEERRAAVRVISSPHVAVDLTELWNAQDGALLKSQATELLARGIHYLMTEWSRSEPRTAVPSRTVRFPLGGQEQIERAQILEKRCPRMLLRRLNGELMSVPVDASSTAASICAAQSPVK